jgi:Antitoxin Xre/MbcA/ParS C-terminal toxin-binding domain/Antitoxin Xre-like helix-turn-helix domain
MSSRSEAESAHAPASHTVIPADRRRDPDVRKRMSGPAMRTFLNIAKKWDLTIHEQSGLLGWPAASTYHKYKAGQVGTLTFDTLIRISLVLGIYKDLHVLYPDPKLANRWIRLPNANPLFGGKTPLEFVIDSGLDGLLRVRRLLDARRGG